MTGAVKSRTTALGLALLRFDFPNWGDDMNKNQQIVDASYSIFGLTISGAWDNSILYTTGQLVVDTDLNSIFRVNITHTSAASGTFAEDRLAHPTYWAAYNSNIKYRGDWVTATQYYTNETFTNDDAWYIVNVSHISGDFEDDLADEFFTVFFDPTGASDSAQASATAAAASAVAAAGSATSASGSASTATTKAGEASTSASSASGSASTATTKAGEASTSASAASGSASTATTKASDAASSADTSTASKNTAVSSAATAVAAAALVTDQEKHGLIMLPQTGETYTLALRMRHAGTITRTTTICDSGLISATFKINTTALGGNAHSVTTSEQSIARTTANTFAAGDDIKVTMASNSACVNMAFSIEYTITS